ncbi:MAG: peptide ABC transporter substrate-binding protein [Clostridiales bacterium]|nr:peptide ABC transporter substrate-binding protein [Clostridiales bacterium]
MKKNLQKFVSLLLAGLLFATALTACGTAETDTADSSATDGEASTASDASSEGAEDAEGTEDTENTSDESYTVLNVAISADPSSFDPAVSLSGDYMYIFGLTQESLTRYGDNQELVDGLADEITHNDDYTQWTFHLRESYWNNGDRVTADDWVYGITRLLDGSTDVAYPDFDYEIKNAKAVYTGQVDASELGVTAQDEYTVVFDLEYPVPYFDKLVTHCQHFGVNRSFVESIGGDDNYGTSAETSLSNGPYYVDSWETDNIVVLKKNSYYWNADNISVDQVNVYIIPDESTQVSMFLNGELDIVDFSAERLSTIENAGYEVQTYNNGRTAYLYYNMTNEYLSNKYIRQAISSAIDRESLVAGVVKNGSSVADGLVPPGLSGADGLTFREIVGSTLTYTYDSDQAQELLQQGLDELGIAADDITFTILTKNTDEFTSVASALQQLLQNELGIHVEVETVDSSSFSTKRSSYDYDVFLTSWGADWDDATNFLSGYEQTEDSNDALYYSEEFNEAYEAAVYTQDQTERIQALGEAEAILLEDQAITPLYYTAQYYAVSDRVTGVIRRSVVPYLDTYFAEITD